MPRTKPTAEACKSSVHARYEVLKQAIRNPKQVPKEVLAACKSQATLAAFTFANLGITPLSRNSMYKYADLVLSEQNVPEGKNAGRCGRHYLDWLRIQVLEAVKKNAGYRTKAAQTQRVRQRLQEQQDKLNETEVHSLRLTKAYLHLFQQVRGYARNEKIDPKTRQLLFNLINDHDALYGDLLSETETFRESNVENLRR